MNHTLLSITAVLSTSGLLLVNFAIKGVVILVLAAFLALLLRRDSAATRPVAVSLIIGAAIAIPVAMLRAAETSGEIVIVEEEDDADEKSSKDDASADNGPGKENPPKQDEVHDEKTSEPGPATQAPTNDTTPELKPKDADGQAVFKIWQANARTDGKIPGALIGQLGGWVEYFIELNDGEGESGALSKKFKELLPRFVATQDWTPVDAVALLDDVAAIHTIPFNNALGAAAERVILTGEPLPAELADAPWGKPAANGLRVAWLLQPRAMEHWLGTSLRSRILVHNSGKENVFFVMPSWQQSSEHAAHNAKGEALEVTSTYWTTMARMAIFRLAPGAYCETPAPGIGVGPRTEEEDWANVRVGSWILAEEGDDVRLTPGAVEVRVSPTAVGTRHKNAFQNPMDAADLWKKFVVERVEREQPIPTGAADREQLLRRVVRELYGVEPNKGEIDAFVADKSPGSLHPLLRGQMVVTRVMHNRSISPFTGTLPPGEIKFRVLAADPDAAKRPRVATGPGYYILGDKQRLQVEQTRNDARLTNKATIRFFSKPKPAPYTISLPDGRHSYAIAWDRDAGELWVIQKGLVRSCDFTDAAQVKETRFESGGIENVPERFRVLPAVSTLLAR